MLSKKSTALKELEKQLAPEPAPAVTAETVVASIRENRAHDADFDRLSSEVDQILIANGEEPFYSRYQVPVSLKPDKPTLYDLTPIYCALLSTKPAEGFTAVAEKAVAAWEALRNAVK